MSLIELELLWEKKKSCFSAFSSFPTMFTEAYNSGLCGKGLLLYHTTKFNPFPKQQILDSSKIKVSVDVNFKFDETDRKFSKQIENNVGKGEIACHKQFLLFQQCFQKTYCRHRERVKACVAGKHLQMTNQILSEQWYLSLNEYKTLREKEEILVALSHHFPKMFSSLSSGSY